MDTPSFTGEALKIAFRMFVRTWRVPSGTLQPSQTILTRVLKFLEVRLKAEQSSRNFSLEPALKARRCLDRASATRLRQELIAELEATGGKLIAEELVLISTVFDQALDRVKTRRWARVLH